MTSRPAAARRRRLAAQKPSGTARKAIVASARVGHRQRPARRRGPGHRSSTSLPDLIGREIPLPLPVPDWSKPIILALFLVSIGFGARAAVTGRRARRLERRQRALTADLTVMQSALVPEVPPRLGDVAVSVAYSPAEGPAAGGDFYDAFELGRERVAIILGDVSGHGRAAIAHAARMRYTLRAYVEAGLTPRESLKLAGSVIGTNTDGLFTTVVVAIRDGGAGSLTYATAGHPPPLTGGHAEHEPLTVCASSPLGWGIRCGSRQTTVTFSTGDRACFFSDGLVEARTESGLLGRDRLAAMFAELGPRPSARALLDQVRIEAREIRDDMAACTVDAVIGEVAAAAERRVEEVELDLDQLAGGRGERFLEACGIAEDEIADAVALARAIASEHGMAVLTSTIPDRSWSVTPSRPVRMTSPRSGPPPGGAMPGTPPPGGAMPLPDGPAGAALELPRSH